MSASASPGEGPPDLPGFRFLQHLGSGGNSQVYLYEQTMPSRKVAVKVLNKAGLTDAGRRQFAAEANAMAGLADHPHIVQVFSADVTADGRPYLVMHYYSRPNLNVRARREHFSAANVLRIGIQIGSAVETSHHNRVLHRDIKPHNILTDQFGKPALTDFGIAARKGADGPEALSVPWSPPEILFATSGGDERSDVYSLGATLWHLLAGRSPFEQPGGDNSTTALMRRIQADPPPRIQRTDVPDSLDRLLRRAMAKDPAGRPQTALEFVWALQAIEQEQRLPATQTVLPESEPPPTDASEPGIGEITLVRGERRIDQWQPAVPTVDRPSGFGAGQPVRHDAAALDATRSRARSVDSWAGAAPPVRQRQLLAESPAAATRIRPTVADPAVAAQDASSADAPAKSRRGRVIGIIGGTLVLLAVGVAAALSRHSAGPPPTQATSSGGPTGVVVADGSVPGKPTISAGRNGADVRFRWTYGNAEAGDFFRWQRISGGSGPETGRTAKPVLSVAAPGGQPVCITVLVERANGTISVPNTRCYP